MILPIIVYGHPTLIKETEDIDKDYPNLQELINNMWQTMYNASGVGLAAPQVNQSIRLFLVDTVQMQDKKDANFKGIKKVFINATLIEENGKVWKYEEGCLSIPGFRENVERKPNIKIHYFDENFNEFEEEYDGINARVIQHEYDHVDGILFTDRLKPLTKKLAQKKLEKIRKGIFEADYKTKVY
ncbi:MAG: peptide deformylase [Chitinophagales bacterium]|nr:peptide deformylase [Chitinophagales bacterium]